MNTIQSQWEAFCVLCMPKDAPQIQMQEMKRAFYAGAEGMIRLLHTTGEASEDGGVMMIEGWHEECRQFALQVVRGKA